jgi:hypothetical protein
MYSSVKILHRTILTIAMMVMSTVAHAESITLQIQTALSERGYGVGTLDGIWGGRTRSALELFLSDNDLEYDGALSHDALQLLGVTRAPVDVEHHSARTLSPAHNPQWQDYSDAIVSPLRGLTVPSNFTLVEDWSTLMSVHMTHLSGQYDVASHFYAPRIDFDRCVDDLSSTTSTTSSRSGQEGVVPISAMCHAMLATRFNNNPSRYASSYANILLNWLDQSTLKNANYLQSRFPNRPNDFNYALYSNVAKVMAHYALYHRLYEFDDLTHAAIVQMLEEFVSTYEYYPAYQRMGQYYSLLCDLSRAEVIGGNDFCGSWNTRMAVGATLFGLEFESQVIFDKGIQHIEIMLAMFDQNAMYAAQIGRGREGLSYADQVNPAIDQLDFAFEKAFGIDFANMETVHGTTPGLVYQTMLKVANNPELMLPYYNPDSDPTARYRGEFRDMVAEIENGQRPVQDVWEAFSERRYILTVPGLAREFHPELFSSYWGQRNKFDYEFGNRITGFSILTLREASWRGQAVSNPVSATQAAPRPVGARQAVDEWLRGHVENLEAYGLYESSISFIDAQSREGGDQKLRFVAVVADVDGNEVFNGRVNYYVGETGGSIGIDLVPIFETNLTFARDWNSVVEQCGDSYEVSSDWVDIPVTKRDDMYMNAWDCIVQADVSDQSKMLFASWITIAKNIDQESENFR